MWMGKNNNNNNNLEEGDQNLQSVSGGGDAANLPLLPEIQCNECKKVNYDIPFHGNYGGIRRKGLTLT